MRLYPDEAVDQASLLGKSSATKSLLKIKKLMITPESF